ncbi:hypothetical protein [Nocardia carnea]|uniref:hypothetical protein n=1 Tax=Nocardia carnea TaxID=37328 RepID=UPI00030391C6|nr:hypothetical protein [Nocardia carnea]
MGTEMWWGTDTAGRRFGVICDRRLGQFTAILRCTAGPLAAIEQGTVPGWGQFLAEAAASGDLATIATARPHRGRDAHITLTWQARTTPGIDDPAVMIGELASRIPALCERLGCYQVIAAPMSDHELSTT